MDHPLPAAPLGASIDHLLSPRDAARILGTSRMTVYRMVGRGELRLVRITTRRVGIRRSELERFIASREVAA